MTRLTIYKHNNQQAPLFDSGDFDIIAPKLHRLSVRCERWKTPSNLSFNPTIDEVIKAYQDEINHFIATEGFKSFDVISVCADNPDAKHLREKYLEEHIHKEDEVRFFVEGSGTFYIHLDEIVYCLHCTKGDLVSVPANVPHWYDMGEVPNFTAIRLFNHPDGWIGYPVNPK